MKNIKTALLFTLIVVTISTMVVCSGSGVKFIKNAEVLKQYMDSQSANSPDKPIKINMNVNDLMMKNVAEVIKAADKYVSLDLFLSTGLTTIGEEAFRDSKALVGIIIPDSVISIGQNAFSGSGLTSINIPKSVITIGEGAFAGCVSLINVTIPDTVTSIGEGAFTGCVSLANIPDKVSRLGEGAFAAPSLVSETISDTVTSIVDDAREQDNGRLNNGGRIVIWSFTDELANMINNRTWGFKATHPRIDVAYSQTPSDRFQAKLDPVISTGQGAPDIIVLESSFVRKYVESGLLLDITDIYEANKSKLLAYPVEVGTYSNKVYSMSWQACPGAMFYRRSLAKKYLGTDDPKTVQTYFSNFNKFLETAKLLNNKSNGTCVVVSSLADLHHPFMFARKNSWIVNGRLVIDPVIEQYLDVCKTLYDNRWEGRVSQWSEDWFAGMRDDFRDEAGKKVEVFSYFLPTWGLHYVLKTNAPSTSGDWAMIQGPSSYHWGGSWVCAYKGTNNVAAVKEFIRYVATDDAFLEAWAKDTGDMVSNINVINRIKDNYREPYLGGQNQYVEFSEIAKSKYGKLQQGSDEFIESILDKAMTVFLSGEKTKAKTLSDFRAQVEDFFSLSR